MHSLFPKRGNRKLKARKFLQLLREAEDPPFEGEPGDIVIPIMGPTGVGKSTFINTLLHESDHQVAVGHQLKSCTAFLHPVNIPFPPFLPGSIQNALDIEKTNRRLIIVDTPGFDDTFVDDSEILRRISVWLATSYSENMKLAGVIYLHDISQTRMLGTTRRNLEMFTKLVGKDALNLVVLGTTKWGLVDYVIASARQSELETTYWKDMREAGSTIFKVTGAKGETSQDIIRSIFLKSEGKSVWTETLAIQQDIMERKRFIHETEAGKSLRFTLDEMIQLQKVRAAKLAALAGKSPHDQALNEDLEQNNLRIKKLMQDANGLKASLSARCKRWLL